MQKLGPQAHAVQQKQQALVQAWKALKLHMEQRKAQLEQACLLAHFHTAVRAPSPGAAHVCVWGCTCCTMHGHALMGPSSPGMKKSVDMKRESMSTSEYWSGWPEC